MTPEKDDANKADNAARREALLSAVGLWKDRTDLPETEEYIRDLRTVIACVEQMHDDTPHLDPSE